MKIIYTTHNENTIEPIPTIHHISSSTKTITQPNQHLNPHPTSNHINFHQNEDGWINFIFPHIYFHFVSQFHNFSIRWPPTRLSARLSLAIPHIRVAIRPAQLSRSHNPKIHQSHPFHSQSHINAQFSLQQCNSFHFPLSQFSTHHISPYFSS